MSYVIALAQAALTALAAAAASPPPGAGMEEVPPEVLARFAPKPLPPELSRTVQAALDVRAPSPGIPSPDGKALYFNWGITGTSQVWKLDGPMRFPVQLTGGEDATRVVDITPDGRLLIVSRDQRGEENPGLYLQPVGGGPLREVQHLPKVQTFADVVSDDGKLLYYRSNDRKADAYALYRYELATGKRELILDEPGLWSVADVRGDGTLLLAMSVGGGQAEYFELAPDAKKPVPLFGQDEREDYSARYGRGQEILVLTPHFGEHRRLYRFQGGKFAPLTPEMSWDIEFFSVDQRRTAVLYAVNEAGYLKLRALDLRSGKELPIPGLPKAAEQVRLGATTLDGRYTALSVDTGTAPPASFVYDWRRRRLTPWHLPSAPEVDLRGFVKATLESYPARDGTPIPAFVYRPARPCEGPCPVIIEFHGGPESQSRAGFNMRAQLFAERGFVLVQPNVRGSSGYGKSWLHADDGKRRLDILTDIEDAALWARKVFAKDGKAPKVGIFGGSYGGYSSLVGMTRFAGTYDAGVSIVGISNLLTFLEKTAAYRRVLRISEYGDPLADRDALIELSPITYVDKLKGPLLIMQGANDPRVPAGESIQIYRALEERKLGGELMIFADEGHGAQRRENQALMIGHALRFFESHLK